jgi:hypothetical protein
MLSSTEEGLLFRNGKGVSLRKPPSKHIDCPIQNHPFVGTINLFR